MPVYISLAAPIQMLDSCVHAGVLSCIHRLYHVRYSMRHLVQPPTRGTCPVWLIGKCDIYQCVRTVSVLLLFEVSLGMYEYVCTYRYVPTVYTRIYLS